MGKITVVESIYHRPGPNQPMSQVPIQFSRDCHTDEQTYGPRQIRVGPEWQPIELGWFKDQPLNVGMIVLVNNEGRFTQRVPTEEERAEAASKVIEVGILIGQDDGSFHKGPLIDIILPFAIVIPTEGQRLTPADPLLLRIRCRNGIARCTLTIFPR